MYDRRVSDKTRSSVDSKEKVQSIEVEIISIKYCKYVVKTDVVGKMGTHNLKLRRRMMIVRKLGEDIFSFSY